MKFYLGSGERVVWRGRPAFPLRYPLLTVLFFLGIFLVLLGNVGAAFGALSFLVSVGFGFVTFWAFIKSVLTNYYITNQRIVSDKGELSLQNLAGMRVQQTSIAMRRISDVHFDSTGGSWLVFKRVKDPETLRVNAFNAKADLARAPLLTSQQATSPQPTQVPQPVSPRIVPQTNQPVREREIVIREVLIQCPYCASRSPQGLTRCPNCGGKL